MGLAFLPAVFLASGCLSGGLVNGSGPRVVHSTSKGELTINYKHSEAELGVPFYPGSKPVEDGSMDAITPGMTMMMQGLQTSDALEKVVAFYTEKLGPPSASGPGFTGETMTGWDHTHPNGASQSVMISGGKDKEPVTILIMVMMPGKEG